MILPLQQTRSPQIIHFCSFCESLFLLSVYNLRSFATQIDIGHPETMIWNKLVVLTILAAAAIDAEAATHVRGAVQEGDPNTEERKLWFYSSSGKGKGSSKGSSTGGGGSSTGGKGASKSSSGSSTGKGSSGKGKGGSKGSKGSSGSSGKVSPLSYICDMLFIYIIFGGHMCIL